MTPARFLGVTVLPEFVQNEGIDAVLDRLLAAGVTAVATSPYVMAPADEQTGSREPPDDAGAGQVRLLDRPLWGRRELFVRTAPSFVPDKKLYAGLRYQPAEPSDLTQTQGHLVADFIRAAQARHVKVYFQVQAAIPPGYRVQFGGPADEDRPRLPDGSLPRRRLANNGSLASPDIARYLQALIRDLCRAYPDIDGLKLDWPEYPPYFLDDVFLDFGSHAQAAASRLGYDVARMRRDAGALYKLLHGSLTNDGLAVWAAPDGGRHALLRALASRRGLLDHLALKADLSESLLAASRQTLTAAAGPHKELVPNAFAPPWSLASGFDFARAARHSSAISVKIYTMHWPMMLKFYGDQLLEANPQLEERLLVETLVNLLDIDNDDGRKTLADFAYPEPDQPHPVSSRAQARKLVQAQREAGAVPIQALVHGYGPASDFRRRLRAALQASPGGLWINRYAYLSDEKLEILGQECGA